MKGVFTLVQVVFKSFDHNEQFNETCVGMSKAEYESMNNEGAGWKCEPCQAKSQRRS